MGVQSQTTKVGYVHKKAFDASTLQVDDIHSIYYQQYGLKDGLPGQLAERK